MKPARLRPPKALFRVLRDLRRSEPWGRRLAHHMVYQVWEDALGSSVTRVARPVSVKGGRVVVEVESSAWLHELELRKEDLLARLNERVHDSKIKDLRFMLAEGGPAWEEEVSVDEKGAPSLKPASIVAADEEAIEIALGKLDDPELKKSAENLLRRVRDRAAEEEQDRP